MNAPERLIPIQNAHANTVTEPNYPRNLWWVAARAEEVTRTPLGLWLLDEPVVLFRKEDGTAVALDNRCPHRWAPLSEGQLVGDNIRCPYHGFEFAADGRCVKIPTQEQIPAKACVKSYALVEQGPVIWIWMGDADKADAALVPDANWLGESQWSWVTGTETIDANYRLLKENVLDLTHVPFVHVNTIGATDWTRPPVVTQTETTVTYTQDFPPTPVPPVYGIPTGVGMQKPVARKNWGTSFTPAYHQGFVEIVDPQPEPGARDRWLFSVCHMTTPISPTQFVYRWFMGWNIELPESYLEAMRANVPKGFAEDKAILEAVQQMVMRDPRGMRHPEVIVQADQGAIQFRRKLDAQLAAERGAS